MPPKSFMCAFLALALVVSCYPCSVACADDLADHLAYCDSLQSDVDFVSEPDNDLSGVEYGRIGEDSASDAQEQHEADSDGGEAVAQDAESGQAQEIKAFPVSEEVVINYDGIESGNSIGAYGIESGQLASPSGTGADNLSGSMSGNGGNLSDSPGAGLTSFTVSDFQEVNSPGQARVIQIAAALPQLAQWLNVGTNIVSIAGGLSSMFGSSMSKTEGLLAIVVEWLISLENAIGNNGVRLLNLYNLITSIYNNDIKGIYSLISHIGVNTDQFKTRLSNISSYLYAEKAEDGLGVANWVVATYYMLKRDLGEGYNASDGYGLINWTIALHDRLKEIKSQLSTISSYLTGKSADDGTGVVNWQIATYRLLNRSLSAWTAGDDNALTNWVIALHDRLKEIKVLISGVSSINPDITVSFDDSAIINAINGSPFVRIWDNDLGSILGAIDGVKDAVALKSVQDALGAIVGDLNFEDVGEAASNLSDTVKCRFPFSIPWLMYDLLILFEAEAAPPSFDFEFPGGAVLSVDFSDYEGLAEFTRFFSVFAWLISLLAVSRRFIFFGGGNDAD